jgi:hypothetical protein
MTGQGGVMGMSLAYAWLNYCTFMVVLLTHLVSLLSQKKQLQGIGIRPNP